ncbi:MAG: LysR family transcriptional regulator [Lachnospiraceae bacterium]|nr:LysR family transcriptional regulator [Lachnospiraceae bacterium]
MTLNQLKYAIAISKENSLNDAAKKLFISQPSLTGAMHALEDEIGFDIFIRSKSGISLTVKGAEFIGYAKSVVEQYDILDAKYISKTDIKRHFSVSMQHYSFAVNAFVEMVKEFGYEEYEFEVHETKTHEIIKNVRNQKSELGVIYMNDFNSKVLTKVLSEEGLEFTPLFDCGICVYIGKNNPLAKEKLKSKESITFEELDDYPCLVFDQGEYNSAYYAEEVMSTHEYKQIIRANDRATMLNLISGLNGYTLCSGILCGDLNGDEYCAIKLDTDEKMTIGYISRKSSIISEIGQRYIEEISKYKDMALI